MSSAGGSLVDCIATTIDPENVLKIFYQAVKAVGHLHSQSTPVIHRDIKVRHGRCSRPAIVQCACSAHTRTMQNDVVQSTMLRLV